MRNVLIFAPFWGQRGHVGNYRVERFIRWFSNEKTSVVVIRAGSFNDSRATQWGQEIVVSDPLGLHSDSGPVSEHRKPNRLRRKLAYLLFNPDPIIVWARLAAKHRAVRQAAKGAKLILSSSPPESAHVGAWKLARRMGLSHCVDMRDGWLDEPLKPILVRSQLRRWQEGRLESRILKDAAVILVSSEVWLEMLCNRFPGISSKVVVLTNAYPVQSKSDNPGSSKGLTAENTLLLVHAGRFTGSRSTQSPDLLLKPLLEAIKAGSRRGVIQLIGRLTEVDLSVIQSFVAPLAERGWAIECLGNLPRSEVLCRLTRADGLLLLSASHAAIPSKLFEYIPASKPLFVVTERGSATWRICESLPQAFLFDRSKTETSSSVDAFLNAAISHDCRYDVPERYSDEFASKVMSRAIGPFC